MLIKNMVKISFHRGVAQPGSAPALGAGSPQFKSGRPDQPSLQNGLSLAVTQKHQAVDESIAQLENNKGSEKELLEGSGADFGIPS